MTNAIAGIDHVIVGVRGLELAREGWSRLGFTLSPRGRHIGLGTGNYCIMFASEYIELLGIVDSTDFVQGLDAFLARQPAARPGPVRGTARFQRLKRKRMMSPSCTT